MEAVIQESVLSRSDDEWPEIVSSASSVTALTAKCFVNRNCSGKTVLEIGGKTKPGCK